MEVRASGNNTTRRLAWALALAVALTLVGWWVTDQIERGQMLAEAKAVEVLPAGVEEAWGAYMDRQLDWTVQPRGDMIKVMGLSDTRQYVSRGEPFQVTCPGRMAILSFGHDDTAALAIINGFARRYPTGEPPPPLGVHPDSLAATALWTRLCDRISNRLEATMAAREPRASFRPAPRPGPPEAAIP